MTLVQVALLVFVVAPLAGLAYAVAKGLQLWRDLRAFFGALGRATGALTERVDRLASFEPPDFERVTASLDRLERSRTQLRVLTGALGRAREQLTAYAAVYPRK